MKKLLLLSLAFAICFALPLMAQDTKTEKKEMTEMAGPPPPLDDAYLNWLAGEWKGWSESPMGKSEDWMKCEKGLGGQYLIMEVKSTSPMGSYEGAGAYTLNQEGGIEAVWIDSFRDMANGKGKREGNVMTMHWKGKMGKGSRVTEKVSDDKFKVTSKWEMADGSVMESTSEYTRVKTTADKQ